jgi:hypothetical protein
VRNEKELHPVKEKRNIILTTEGRKANWIGHVLRRNCLLKHISDGRRERSDGKTRKKVYY